MEIEKQTFRKISRATEKDGWESWGGCQVANTLNTFENSDVRATTIVTETAFGFDAYNQQMTGGVAKSLNNRATDTDHIPVVFTLKIRGGRETYMKRDGTIGTAGKGALIQTDQASTLGVTQDQYLFVPEEKDDLPRENGRTNGE